MQYNIILDGQELELISSALKEGPYRIVKPLLDSIASQVELQNKEETLTDKKD